MHSGWPAYSGAIARPEFAVDVAAELHLYLINLPDQIVLVFLLYLPMLQTVYHLSSLFVVVVQQLTVHSEMQKTILVLVYHLVFQLDFFQLLILPRLV